MASTSSTTEAENCDTSAESTAEPTVEPNAPRNVKPSEESGADRLVRRMVVRILLVVLVLALVTGGGVLAYLVWSDAQRENLRSSAGEDAARMVAILGSYDFNDVDANLREVTAISTPEFAQRYSEVAGNLRELISNGKGTSEATVPRAAVDWVDESQAVVLVFLDQQITNVTVPKGRLDASRMVVTLARDGNSWKLNGADVV